MQKKLAIAWLEHLVGDLHQPLHTTTRAFGPDDKGDRGGNAFSLTPKGTPRDRADNLHSFWDSVIGRNMPNSAGTCDTAYLVPIAESIMKEYPFSKLQSRLAPGDFSAWEKESVEIATKEVYRGVKRNEPRRRNIRKGASIGEERMALAGYRMGELFNELFGSKK